MITIHNKGERFMLYFSFDLSFTGTGICMMDDAEKKITFWQVKTTLDKKKTFDMVWQLKDVYINEKMILETPSKSESEIDSEYKKYADIEDIPF